MTATVRIITGMLLKGTPKELMREVRGFSVGAPGSTAIRGTTGLRSGTGSTRTSGTTIGDFDARRLPGNPWRFCPFTLGQQRCHHPCYGHSSQPALMTAHLITDPLRSDLPRRGLADQVERESRLEDLKTRLRGQCRSVRVSGAGGGLSASRASVPTLQD